MNEADFTNKNTLAVRLEIAKLMRHLGKEPWQKICNQAYEQCYHPSISVIISLYNYAQYIRECLDSVAVSTTNSIPGGIEIIVLDDSSSDNSAAIVEDFLQKSPIPICLIKKLYNTGLADTRNTGLSISRSPYVFILDADNRIYPHCLSELYQEISSSNYASVYGIIEKFDNSTNQQLGYISNHEWDVPLLVKAPYIDAMALFNKNIILSLGGYSTELMTVGWSGWEDYDLWLKIAQAGYSCKFVPKVLTSYRVHSHSMLSKTNEYKKYIVKYFTYKFTSLLQQHQLDMVFSFPRSEIEASDFLETKSRELELLEELLEKQIQGRQEKIDTLQVELMRSQSQLQQTQSQLQQTQSQLQQTQSQLQQTQSQLQQTQSQLQQTQSQLQQTQSELGLTQIEASNLQHQLQAKCLEIEQFQQKLQGMESSKFWKMRLIWMEIKGKLRIG